MKLSECVAPGNILLICPKNWFGRLIAKFTFGKVNHAAIVYDSVKLFETDGDQFKAGFADINKYDGRDVFIVSGSYISDNIADVQRRCKLYNKSPYSYWDICTNAIFFFLARPIRTKAVRLFGNKSHMVCSELVSRIVFESTGNKIWADYEGITPEDIRDIALENPEIHKIKFFNKDKII